MIPVLLYITSSPSFSHIAMETWDVIKNIHLSPDYSLTAVNYQLLDQMMLGVACCKPVIYMFAFDLHDLHVLHSL